MGNQPFGCKYKFKLADERVNNYYEYMVPWNLLMQLADRAGLVPVCNDNFHTFFSRMVKAPQYVHMFAQGIKIPLATILL